METWEAIALRLAGQAGIATLQHELIDVAGKPVMLSRRFDRDGSIHIPFARLSVPICTRKPPIVPRASTIRFHSRSLRLY